MSWYELVIGNYATKYKIMNTTTNTDKSIKVDSEGKEIKRETINKASYKWVYKDTKEEYKGQIFYMKDNEISDKPFVYPRTTLIPSNEIDELETDFVNKLLSEKYLFFDSEELKNTLRRFNLAFGFTFVLRESEKSYYCVVRLEENNLIGYLAVTTKANALDNILANKPIKELAQEKNYLKPKSILKQKFNTAIKVTTDEVEIKKEKVNKKIITN